MIPTELRTTRLRLRRWSVADLEPFAELNANARVMEHYPAPLTRTESDAMVARIEATFDQEQYGLWAVEITRTRSFAGYVGLWPARFPAPFTPAVEIGWRLAHDHWGNGFATEAADAAAADGFDRLGVAEIVSFTARSNERSRRVMARLGMTHDDADDFEHPALAVGHPLRAHVLYRLPNPRPG